MAASTLPLSTYRLQMSAAFTFADATAIVDYLARSASRTATPRATSRRCPGSTHGYDVADPTRLNPEIGDEASYQRVGRGAARPRHGAHHRSRAQPHGHRPVGQPVVAGRAGERRELALRRRLRHRLASAEAGAREQGAAADPRRPVRRRARTAGDRARVRRAARSASRYYDQRVADRAGHLRPHARAGRAASCSRRSAPRARTASSSSAS